MHFGFDLKTKIFLELFVSLFLSLSPSLFISLSNFNISSIHWERGRNRHRLILIIFLFLFLIFFYFIFLVLFVRKALESLKITWMFFNLLLLIRSLPELRWDEGGGVRLLGLFELKGLSSKWIRLVVIVYSSWTIYEERNQNGRLREIYHSALLVYMNQMVCVCVY